MKTATGFEYEINKKALNNMELIDALAEIEDNPENLTASVKVITLLLGKEGKKRLYNHVREADGCVPIEKVMAEVTDIFNGGSDDLKKSSSSSE